MYVCMCACVCVLCSFVRVSAALFAGVCVSVCARVCVYLYLFSVRTFFVCLCS